MRDRLVKIMEEILNEKINNLNDDDIIPENLENWDSLKHLSLVTALEDEFNIVLEPNEIILMNQGIKYIIDVLKKHGVN
mgnify:CR=1 FL=1